VSSNQRKPRNNDERGCEAVRVYYGAGHMMVTVTALTFMQ